MKPDRLDEMLAAHFKAEPVSLGLAGRVARTADAAARELEGLLGRLAVTASPRGVVRIRPGRQGAADTAAARRLVERARGELAEYLDGQRAFFSVPVDLTEAPEFQRRVLGAAMAIPSNARQGMRASSVVTTTNEIASQRESR